MGQSSLYLCVDGSCIKVYMRGWASYYSLLRECAAYETFIKKTLNWWLFANSINAAAFHCSNSENYEKMPKYWSFSTWWLSGKIKFFILRFVKNLFNVKRMIDPPQQCSSSRLEVSCKDRQLKPFSVVLGIYPLCKSTCNYTKILRQLSFRSWCKWSVIKFFILRCIKNVFNLNRTWSKLQLQFVVRLEPNYKDGQLGAFSEIFCEFCSFCTITEIYEQIIKQLHLRCRWM